MNHIQYATDGTMLSFLHSDHNKVRPVKLYLSGPMSGLPQCNFPAFHAATQELRDSGFEVWSPAERDTIEDGFDPLRGDARPAQLTYAHFMKRDLPAVCDSDAVAVLPGWERSKGACLEVHVAREIGIPVVDAATRKSVYVDEIQMMLNEVSESVAAVTHSVRRTGDAVLTSNSDARKDVPMARGLLDYFPAALVEVARLSAAANAKHNPGEPLHWSRDKSNDHADCLMRHMVDRGSLDDDGFSHTVKVAWRALALLQEELETNGAPRSRGSA